MTKITLQTSKLTPAKAEFIVAQCEKSLQRTLEDRDAIQRKGTFVLGVLSAIIAFGVNSIIENIGQWPRSLVAYLVVEVVILVSLSIPIIWTYLPSLYAGHGYDPKKIIKGEFINQDLERMQIGYAHELQFRINYNRNWNKKTAIRLKRIASAAMLSPILTLVVLLVFRCVFLVA
ncbi:MAG: hypothetical protein MUE94_11745 [Verrucomicrobia bacterium]|jgi:hypothetical protein|nr:hypothetical protein [Verrucomicrobiota bacterium]